MRVKVSAPLSVQVRTKHEDQSQTNFHTFITILNEYIVLNCE